ncbi:MAG: O-antigen ligase family protein [Acidimicrobiales bacterium]
MTAVRPAAGTGTPDGPSTPDGPGVSHLAAEPVRRFATLTRPGPMEQTLVVLTTFVLVHQTPNVWFRTRADFLIDSSNPVAVVLALGLVGLAFARVAGSVDQLIAIIRGEPAVFLFAGLTFASTFWSADPAETVQKSVPFVAVTAYGAYLVMRFSLNQIMKLLSLMFVISGVLNLVTVVALPVYGVDTAGQFSGIFPEKNMLGYVAALALPTLLLAGKSWRRWRWLFWPGAVLQLGLLVGSQSKTMLLAALGPTCLIAVYQLFRSRKTLRGAVIISLFGTAVFTVAFATANIAVLARWLDKDITLTGRVPLWENLIPIATHRPLLGSGYGAVFNGYFSPIHEVWIQNQWNPTHAHNAILQITLEIGLVGAVLFLVTYLRGVTRAIKIVAIVPGPAGLWPLVFLTTTLLVSITESGVNSDDLGWLMFVVTILSISLHLRYRNQLGLSNDLQDAIDANAHHRVLR